MALGHKYVGKSAHGLGNQTDTSLSQILTRANKLYHPALDPPMHHNIMKTNLILLLTTLAASIMATPVQDSPDGIDDKLPGSCYHASRCSIFLSGKCEAYCGNWGFSHMSSDGCPRFSRKCCCSR